MSSELSGETIKPEKRFWLCSHRLEADEVFTLGDVRRQNLTLRGPRSSHVHRCTALFIMPIGCATIDRRGASWNPSKTPDRFPPRSAH